MKVTRECYIKSDNKEAKSAIDKFQAKLDSLIANQCPPKSKIQPIKGVM